jgi:hypothetical protein
MRGKAAFGEGSHWLNRWVVVSPFSLVLLLLLLRLPHSLLLTLLTLITLLTLLTLSQLPAWYPELAATGFSHACFRSHLSTRGTLYWLCLEVKSTALPMSMSLSTPTTLPITVQPATAQPSEVSSTSNCGHGIEYGTAEAPCEYSARCRQLNLKLLVLAPVLLLPQAKRAPMPTIRPVSTWIVY